MNRKDWIFIKFWSNKIRAINYLGAKCNNCSDNNIFHLTFHHYNIKNFEINDLLSKRWSRLLSEINYCQLLCANCHNNYHFLDKVVDDTLRFNKVLYLNYKGKECEICKYNESQSSLIFHHINPKDKSYSISRHRIRYTEDIGLDIKNELNKCQVLCQNCHNEKHINIEKFILLKEKIYEKVYSFKEISGKINRQEVESMYNNGISQKDIAISFKVSRGTISDIIKELGINREYRIDINKVAELYKGGLSPIDIARTLGINKNSIYKVVKKLKIVD